MFEKSCHLDRIVDRSNTLKKFFFYVLLFLGVVFSFPSQYSLTKLQLHAMQKLCHNFCCIVFLYASAQKNVLDF